MAKVEKLPDALVMRRELRNEIPALIADMHRGALEVYVHCSWIVKSAKGVLLKTGES